MPPKCKTEKCEGSSQWVRGHKKDDFCPKCRAEINKTARADKR